MLGDTRKFTIFQKDWRERWVMLVQFFVPLVVIAFWVMQKPQKISLLLPIWFVLFSAACGSKLLTIDERDPARSFIYALPLSRGRILWLKLKAIVTQWLTFGLVYLLIIFTLISISDLYVTQSGSQEDFQLFFRAAGKEEWLIQQFALPAIGLPLLFLSAIFSLHLRSEIVSLVLAIVFAGIITFILMLNIFIPADQAAHYYPKHFFEFALRVFILGILLALWLWFVFARTPLQEQGPTRRALLGLLFGVGLIELTFLLFLTGWRDLIFIIFGR